MLGKIFENTVSIDKLPGIYVQIDDSEARRGAEAQCVTAKSTGCGGLDSHSRK